MGVLQLRPEFFDVYLELAVDFDLPLRLSGASSERAIGFPFRRLAAAEGVVFPDRFVHLPGAGVRQALDRVLSDLRPGVTEVIAHPAVESDELRAAAPDWARRVDDHAYLTRDQSLVSLITRVGGVLVGYRDLRDLQRAG
jgi:hypothetical protein